MKRNICPICNSHIVVYKKYDHHLENKNVISLLKQLIKSILKRILLKANIFNGTIIVCESCGYGIMENIPPVEKLKNYYKTSYWNWRSIKPVEISNNEYKNDCRANAQLKFISQYSLINGFQNSLEIGAGPAYASLLLRNINHNIKLHICEPGKQWINYYENFNLIKIADYFPFESEIIFDYIHTSHWLEHVSDINQTLLTLNKMLEINGYLFVEVPNTETEYWNLDIKDSPHIHFFTKKSLIKLFEKFGFSCLSIGEYGITYQEYINDVPITSDKYDLFLKKNGIWLRSIFMKINNIK
jgi:hypothetical protein